MKRAPRSLLPLLLASINAFSQPALIPYRARDAWGYCNKDGKVLIKPQYQDAEPFENGLAVIKLKGKKGLIDEKGHQVTSAKYDAVFPFSSGLAKVSVDGKFGYIDRKGKEICPAEYETAEDFQEGFAFVRKDKWGVIDSTGKSVIPFRYPAFSRYNKDVGFDYSYLKYKFAEGMAKVLTDSGFIYINPKGEPVFSKKFGEATTFRQGVAVVSDYEGGARGLIDKSGKIIVPLEYDHFGYLSEGLRAAKKNGKWGYIDAAGKKVIDFQYDSADDFENGIARVEKETGYGYIDKQGKEVIPCEYTFIGPFKEGLAAAKKYYYGYLKPDNTWAIKDLKSFASPFSEGLGAVQANKFSMGGNQPEIDNKWGYMNAQDQWVVKPKYENAMPFSNGIARVKMDGRWGYIGKDGKEYFNMGRFDTVTVSNAEELIAALSPNRRIQLRPGTYELYDLEALKEVWERKNSNARRKESHDHYIAPQISYSSGWGVALSDMQNIAIIGMGKQPNDTRILMKDQGDHVLTFENCRNITIRNIEAGHTEGAGGGCDAGVLLFGGGCSNFRIQNTILFGSGTIGLNGSISDLDCDSVTIKECSEGIISLEESGKNLRFNACSFVNNKDFYGGSYINLGVYDNVTFSNCTITGNTIDDKYGKPGPLFKFKEASNVTITNCVIENNMITGLYDNEAVVKQSGLKVNGNSFQK